MAFLRCAFFNVFSNGPSERMLHCLCHQHCNRHRFHIISLFTILFFIQVWIISTAPSSSSFFSMRHIFKASITYLCLSHQRQNKNCSIYTKEFSSCTKVIFLSKRIGISSNDDPATWCKIIITATIMIVSLWHCSNLIIIIIIIIITLITPALFHFFTEIIIIIKTVAVCTVQCRFGGKNDPFGTFFKLYLSKIQKKIRDFLTSNFIYYTLYYN